MTVAVDGMIKLACVGAPEETDYMEFEGFKRLSLHGRNEGLVV